MGNVLTKNAQGKEIITVNGVEMQDVTEIVIVNPFAGGTTMVIDVSRKVQMTVDCAADAFPVSIKL
jgi:hypothetical protein